MLVPLEGYQEVWQQIKQESLSHSTYRAVIFVACMDVDAFVASLMVSALLKKHLILYKTEPVSGYESLRLGFKRLDQSIRNVFFIGCGSSVDLEELLGLDGENEKGVDKTRPKIHVFDRNRPWNLNNLFGSELVYCYEDGNAEDIEIYRKAYTSLASGELSGGSESEDHSNNESEAELELGRRPRRAIDSDSENEDDIQGNQDAEEDVNTQEDEEQYDEVVERTKKRRKTQRSANIKLLEEYYRQGSHIVSTNAVQVYTLLTLIGETSSSMLWLSIIGVTSIELQHPQLYRVLLPSLRDEMRRLNQQSTPGPGGSRHDERNNSIKFFCEADYSLFLLRQWSLYESMIHSSYVSAKLFLWREDGRKKLHKMLARIGITLQDAKETWIHTKPSLKRELKSKLDSVSGSYGIEGITRDGVVRQFGLAGSMSAGDCVESIAAYLEVGKTEPSFLTADKHPTDDANGANADNDIGGADANNADQLYESWVRNFWIAWDSVNNFDRLKAGSEQAKVLQRAVVSTANFIFDKNLPKDLRSFRMVIVQDAPSMDVFFNPLSLQRLAVWVAEGCAEIHSSNTPFVLAVLNEPRNVYLVIGMGDHRSRDLSVEEAITTHNHFGRQFQATARAINAKVRIDAFESSIIEVSRTDLPRFLEALDSQIQSE